MSSDPHSVRHSTDKIFDLFLANGYPSRWLAGVARQARTQHQNKVKRTKLQKDKVLISLPDPFIDDNLTCAYCQFLTRHFQQTVKEN